MLGIVISDERERVFNSSIRDWVKPLLISAGMHALLGGLATSPWDYSESVNAVSPETHSEVNDYSPTKSLEQIIAEAPNCTPNPQKGIVTAEENQFVETLVEDLQDKKLDSMSLGEYFVRADTFYINRTTNCKEQLLDVNQELQSYQAYRNMALDHVTSADIAFRANDIFDFLHHSIYPYSKEDPKIQKQIEKYGPSILDPPLLRRNNWNEEQAIFLKVKTKGFDCKSSTKWFSAVANEDPLLKGKVFTYVPHDQHILSVIMDKNNFYYFENTSQDGDFAEPEMTGKVFPLESFVVEYLVTQGKLEQLPLEFRDWYKINEKSGLKYSHTNEYGQEAKIGVSKDSNKELEKIRFSYSSTKENKVTATLDVSNKYKWEKVWNIKLKEFEELYNNYENLENRSQAWVTLRHLEFILSQIPSETNDSELDSITKENNNLGFDTRRVLSNAEAEIMFYSYQHTLEEDLALSSRDVLYLPNEYDVLNEWLHNETHWRVSEIIERNDDYYKDLFTFQLSSYESKLNLSENNWVRERMLFLGLSHQYFDHMPKDETTQEFRNLLIETGLKQLSYDSTNIPTRMGLFDTQVLRIMFEYSIDNPNLNSRILAKLQEEDSNPNRHTSSFELDETVDTTFKMRSLSLLSSPVIQNRIRLLFEREHFCTGTFCKDSLYVPDFCQSYPLWPEDIQVQVIDMKDLYCH